MSTNLAYALPARSPRHEQAEEQHQRKITAVAPLSSRRAKPRLSYAVVAITVIFCIFLAQLLLSIALSGGAYTISGLQVQQRNLGREASGLNERLNTMGSTQNLVANAKALGMVASGSQAFLRLSDGKVIGTSTAAHSGGGDAVQSGATGTVPNYLLTNVPLVTASSPGHGASNAGDADTGGSESTASGSSGSAANDGSSAGGTSGGNSAGSTNPGEIPSPHTH